MKILLTAHQFLPHFSSGTEIMTYEVAKELKSNGHQVSVFTCFPSHKPLHDEERFDRYVYEGIDVEVFNHNYAPMGDQKNVMEMEYDNRLLGTYFKEYLARERPDLVHFFHLSRLSAAPIDACNELGIPTVLTPTDFWFICPTCQLRMPDNSTCLGPDKSSVNCLRHIMANNHAGKYEAFSRKMPDWLLAVLTTVIKKGIHFDNHYSPLVHALSERRDFLKKRINRIDKVVVPTKVMHAQLTRNGLDPRQTVPVPFGLNMDHFEETKEHIPSDKLRIGFIGTIYEHKGVHVLFEAVRQLAGKPIELKIYGKTDDFPAYVEKLKMIGRNDPRIEFCGTFPNDKIGDIFSALDVLVVPSLWHENTPLVIYSAQAVGVPVVVSNMAGMTEVIEHRKNGLIFEAGDAMQLAEAIRTLLEDRELLRRLSADAKKPLSIRDYVSKLSEIYETLDMHR
jgi:glycosyltransferase involved in cell wall biosynthesis